MTFISLYGIFRSEQVYGRPSILLLLERKFQLANFITTINQLKNLVEYAQVENLLTPLQKKSFHATHPA